MATATAVTAADVRAWAVENGHDHLEGKRGRLPSSVIEEFNKGKRGAKRYTPAGSAD